MRARCPRWWAEGRLESREQGGGRDHGQRRGGRWRRREGGGSLAVGWVFRVLQRPGRLPLEGRVPLLISKALMAGGPTKKVRVRLPRARWLGRDAASACPM